jgi:DedD protein
MDIALKQRLVGASVLIALAVVVLPMLLGGRSEDGGVTQKVEVPEQPPELDFETRRYPVGESRPPVTTPTADEPMTLPAPTPRETPAEPDVDENRSESRVEPAMETPPPGTESIAGESVEKPVTVITPEPAPSAAPAGTGRYLVQVASFGAVANAQRLTGQLEELGYTVHSDTVESDVGTLHRVRVGPYASESDADRAVGDLKTQVRDVTPRVMDIQPEKSSAVTKPSDPLVRWVVQVGSFSSTTNADNLVARLKLQGLNAYRESVSSGGKTIYRVRVGPYIERDEAIRVNDQKSLDGVVMSAD